MPVSYYLYRKDIWDMLKKKDLSDAQSSVNIKLVRVMSRNLRDFLEHSLNAESFWEKWTALDFTHKRIRCWEITKCASEDCPSYLDNESRCWLKTGTLCGGEVQGDFAKKFRTCFDCKVLKQVEMDDVRALYENINILIHHLKKRDETIMETAITDQLTGVYNRSYFNAFMDKMLAYASRYGEQISFVMVDLDGFKGLNDSHGHHAGDVVLIETAALLKGVMRDSDLLFRYGGDEFLIALPHADCERAEAVKERIQLAVDAWNHKNLQYENFRLSLSLGCSTWKQGDDLVSRIKEADTLMYLEKRQKKESCES